MYPMGEIGTLPYLSPNGMRKGLDYTNLSHENQRFQMLEEYREKYHKNNLTNTKVYDQQNIKHDLSLHFLASKKPNLNEAIKANRKLNIIKSRPNSQNKRVPDSQ